MPKKTIHTDRAPAAVGPYSQAVISGGLLFTSGQLPIDPATGKIPEGDIETRAHIVFKNLEAIARQAGTSLDDAVKTTVYLADMADFEAFNRVYAEFFRDDPPARVCVEISALPKAARIEIEAVAAV